MNSEKVSGIVVFQGVKVKGMFNDKALLRNFVPLSKGYDEVRVAKLSHRSDKFLGWVTLSNLAREVSKTMNLK